MTITVRKDRKYHVNGIVDMGLYPHNVSALSFEREIHLAFRNSGSIPVKICAPALYEMVMDLSSGNVEKMGFLLGYSHCNSFIFTRYDSAEWITSNEGGIIYSKKNYIKYLRKASSLGFDVQADVHSHLYEKLYQLDVGDEERTIFVGDLLRRGVFFSLEKSAGFTKFDILDSREKHSMLKKMGLFLHSFSGVFERFSLGAGNMKIVTFRIASGPRMENHHGIHISELGE